MPDLATGRGRLTLNVRNMNEMKEQLRIVILTLSFLGMISCGDSQTVERKDDSQASREFDRVVALVDELKQIVETDFAMTAATWDGKPVIVMDVEDPASDYSLEVEKVRNAVTSFEGELMLVFEQSMELTESDKANGLGSSRKILAVFNAKTGERL